MRAAVVAWLAFLPTPAFAVDQGDFANEMTPAAKEWFQAGAPARCCNEADGHRGVVRRVGRDWEAYIDNDWYTVPQGSVLDIPSPFAVPVIWYYRIDGRPKIRCLALPTGT